MCHINYTLFTQQKACWENKVQKTGLPTALVSNKQKVKESESRSVLSNSLWPHGLYSPWNSPGQNTGVGSLSLLQGIFPTQGSNPGLPYCRQILYQLSYQGSPRILEWVAYPLSSDLSNPGIKLVSPALQTDSLPTELPRKTLTSKVIPKEAISGCLKASECRKRWLLESTAIRRTGLFACL